MGFQGFPVALKAEGQVVHVDGSGRLRLDVDARETSLIQLLADHELAVHVVGTTGVDERSTFAFRETESLFRALEPLLVLVNQA